MTNTKLRAVKTTPRNTIYVFLIFIFLISASCRSTNEAVSGNRAAENSNVVLPDDQFGGFQVPSPDVNLANPLVVSQRPEDVGVCEKINKTIESSPSSNSRWGVFAVSLKDGRVVCERDGRKLFNPASIQKTLTAIVALDRLGADFRWTTFVYGNQNISADGTLDGDLILYGQGAPDFDSVALEDLAVQLQAKGLKRVKGNVVGDASYFRGDSIGDGWTWNELQWYYGAEASALSFNENQAFINVENGQGRASNDYLQVTVGDDKVNSNSNSNANVEASGIKRGLEDNDFYVWGNAKNFGARVSVHDPAKLAAKSLKELLEKKGIAVEGNFNSRDWKASDKLDPAKAIELAAVQSQTLGEAVTRMNKHSVNLIAELILRSLGKQFGSEVPGEIQRPQNVRGDDTAGAAVIKKWLVEHRAAADEVEIYDGSGLSRLDFVTPETFARAFIAAAQTPAAKAFADSLPIAATDGTLGGRFGNAKGKVIAKTGTITFVNSLAGYAASENGEVYAFAVIVNNARKNAQYTIDQAVMKLINPSDDEKNEKEEVKATPTPKNLGNANSNQNVGFYERNLSGKGR